MSYNIMGIVIENRDSNAPDIQEILTKFGCLINLRIGYHEKIKDACLNEGLVILELSDDKLEIEKLQKELKTIKGIRTQTITL